MSECAVGVPLLLNKLIIDGKTGDVIAKSNLFQTNLLLEKDLKTFQTQTLNKSKQDDANKELLNTLISIITYIRFLYLFFGASTFREMSAHRTIIL